MYINYIFFYSRHGLGRTDFYILNDPELSFREIVQKNLLSAVSGSFTTEMLEAAKLETAKTEAAKLETTKTDITKLNIVKTEAVKIEPTKSETIDFKVSESETAKTEKVDTDIKIESADELQETEVEKVEVNDSTSDETEPTRTEAIEAEINEDIVINTNKKVVIRSNDEPEELMDVDSKENKKPVISNDNGKVEEEVSDVPTEQSNDKSSDKIDNQQNEIEESENKSEEKKQADVEKIEVENTVKSCDVKSKIESIINVINELPSEINNKSDTKVTEPIAKSKECSSVESVDRLKAMFPELEVVHKDLSTPTIDKLPMHKPLQQIDQTIAHLLATSYQNPIKWPKVRPTTNYKYTFFFYKINLNI